MKKNLLIIGLILILFVLLLTKVGLNNSTKEQPDNTKTIKATSSPIVSPNNQNLETFSSDILSFNYPKNLKLEERQPNYFVLLLDPANPQSVFASIDARLTGDYQNYETAIELVKENLVEVQSSFFLNGVKISGKLGPGYAQGQKVLIVIFKYNSKAIKFETTVTKEEDLKVFEEIINSVKIYN